MVSTEKSTDSRGRNPNSLKNLRMPWKAGEAPNPKGSSQKAHEKMIFKQFVTQSDRESVYRIMIEKAKRGDFQFCKEVMDRIEGKVPNKKEEHDSDSKPYEMTVVVQSEEAKRNLEKLREMFSGE